MPLSTDLSMHTMDRLIGRDWKRTTSDDEERALRAWREASEHNETYYRELIHLLELAAATDGRERLLIEPSAADLIQLAQCGAEEAVSAPFWRRPWVVPVFVTGPSETATVTLGDGTVVRMAPGSRIRVDDAPRSRDVLLNGKAYFAVAKMEQYPFRVRTRVGDVVALGTRFDVINADEELRVVVAEGRVALGGGSNRVELNAGEMSLMKADKPSPPVEVEVAPMLAWVGRFSRLPVDAAPPRCHGA